MQFVEVVGIIFVVENRVEGRLKGLRGRRHDWHREEMRPRRAVQLTAHERQVVKERARRAFVGAAIIRQTPNFLPKYSRNGSRENSWAWCSCAVVAEVRHEQRSQPHSAPKIYLRLLNRHERLG
jgi:hypothetical protein